MGSLTVAQSVELMGLCGLGNTLSATQNSFSRHEEDVPSLSWSSTATDTATLSSFKLVAFIVTASMALMANAVVTPRFPSLKPADPYRYIQLSSHPPSSHCRDSRTSRSILSLIPNMLQARRRTARLKASPHCPIRSWTRSLRSGLSQWCSSASCV